VANLAIGDVDAGQVDLGHKVHHRGLVGVGLITNHPEGVDTVLVDGLRGSVAEHKRTQRKKRTLMGPMIVPFQFVIIRSSPLVRP